MDTSSFRGVDVDVIQETRNVHIVVTHPEGNTTTFVIKANAAHCGCEVLDVRVTDAEKYEPDWVDLEQQQNA